MNMRQRATYETANKDTIARLLLVAASIHYRIAIGPNAGRKALTLRTFRLHLACEAARILAPTDEIASLADLLI